jgi:hypothetical protein
MAKAISRRSAMSNTAEYERWGRPGWAADRPTFFERPWHPGWIVLTVLGFIVWWPIGLALLFFTLGSRRMSCMGRYDGRNAARWQEKMERMQYKMERFRSRMEGRGYYGPSSGNRAFDEYREETLKRLEEEQSEFKGFLDRLRHAKDKAEFDQFMNERRNRPTPPPPPTDHQPPPV